MCTSLDQPCKIPAPHQKGPTLVHIKLLHSHLTMPWRSAMTHKVHNQKMNQNQGHKQRVTPSSTIRNAHRLGTLRLLACRASCSVRSRRLSSSVSPVASLAQPIQSVRIYNKRTRQFRSTSTSAEQENGFHYPHGRGGGREGGLTGR